MLKIIPHRWNKESGVGDTCIPRALLAAPFGPCASKITRHKLVSLFKMPFRYTFSYFVKSESCCNEEWRVKLLFVETIVLQSVSKFVSDKSVGLLNASHVRGSFWRRYACTKHVLVSVPRMFSHRWDDIGRQYLEKFQERIKSAFVSLAGLEGTMWGELIRTADQMHSMIFPRLLAAAERAWHKGSWEDLRGEERQKQLDEDWVNFANTLGHRELVRLDKMDVPYRVPPPVARFV